MPPEFLGPLGLTIALGFAVAALWRDHQRADADDRTQRNEAIAGWREQQAIAREQVAATNRLADALEADIRERAQRQRRTDR